METKTVEGYFGKSKQITRQDFVTRWTNVVSDVASLATTQADYAAAKAMVATVEEMAGRKWDAMKG